LPSQKWFIVLWIAEKKKSELGLTEEDVKHMKALFEK